MWVRRYGVDRGNRGDRFAKDEDRKRSEGGLGAGSPRGRRRDRQDRPDEHGREPIRVPKKREEAHVERIPAEGGRVPEEIEVRDDEVLIPVTEEEVVVERQEVVKEVLRVRKDVVEDEEIVDADVHETDKRRDSNERARRGSSGSDRRAATGREEDMGREPRVTRHSEKDRGGTSFIDRAKDALSGADKGGRREGTSSGGTREDSRGPRQDEPPRSRR